MKATLRFLSLAGLVMMAVARSGTVNDLPWYQFAGGAVSGYVPADKLTFAIFPPGTGADVLASTFGMSTTEIQGFEQEFFVRLQTIYGIPASAFPSSPDVSGNIPLQWKDSTGTPCAGLLWSATRNETFMALELVPTIGVPAVDGKLVYTTVEAGYIFATMTSCTIPPGGPTTLLPARTVYLQMMTEIHNFHAPPPNRVFRQKVHSREPGLPGFPTVNENESLPDYGNLGNGTFYATFNREPLDPANPNGLVRASTYAILVYPKSQ